MADYPVPEKLLRGMTVEGSLASGSGVTVYELTHAASGQRFVLKHISIPASEDKVEALILSGAYADRDEAARYYQHIAEDLVREIRCNRALSECPNILRFLSYQLIPHEGGVGYDLYTITARQQSLRQFRQKNAMSHLMALNLGIDLCAALEAIHEAGFVFQDLRPGNVFLTESGRFLLGDFGLAPMQDMQYSSLPEQFLSEYSAPELGGVLTGLNPTIDIYSLGMLLYRIYNGYHAPFEDETTGVAASEERRRSGEALPAPIYADYELAAILNKACAFRPEDRYQTPGELRAALAEYMHRNAVDDTLIVPPLVGDGEPLLEEMPDDEPEPVRFANVEELDEDFKTHFSPDTGSLRAVIAAVRKEEEKHGASEDVPPAPPAEGKPISAPGPMPKLETGEKDSAAKKKKPEKKPEKPQPAPKPAKKKKKRRGRMRPRKQHIFGWVLIGLLALVVTAVLLYCFTPLGHDLYEFDIVVDSITVTDETTDSITVEIVSNAKPGLLTASCQDAYGNAFTKSVDGAPLTFTELTPGTQYTISVSLEGLHRLSGTTSAPAATLSKTEILTFAATGAAEDGVVTLTLVVKDENTEPETWNVSIEAEGEQARTETFSGHTATITGLTVGKEYSFRLLENEDYSLIGQTETRFTPQPVIKADALGLGNLLDGTATIVWRCTSVLPESWTLVCEKPDGTESEQQIKESEREPDEDGTYACRASFDGIEAGKSYTFRLSADGMFQILSYTLEETVPYVNEVSAAQDGEALTVQWSASAAPEGGWLLTVEFGSDGFFQTAVSGSVYAIDAANSSVPLLPDTEYRFTLTGAGEQQPMGHTEARLRTEKAGNFSGRGVDLMNTVTGLRATPEGDWSGKTLQGRDPQTRFRASDGIEILLRNRKGVTKSDDTVQILLLVRDADGAPVSWHFDAQVWDEMWVDRNWIFHLPDTPQTPGSYTVEVYLDNALLRTLEFTIVE